MIFFSFKIKNFLIIYDVKVGRVDVLGFFLISFLIKVKNIYVLYICYDKIYFRGKLIIFICLV